MIRNQEQNEWDMDMVKKRRTMRHKMITLFLLCASSAFHTCQYFKGKETADLSNAEKTVTIYDYQLQLSAKEGRKLRDSIVTQMYTSLSDGHRIYFYALNDTLPAYASFSTEKDSLFLDGVYCPNVDTIYLSGMEIIQSHYDIENSMDEEQDVYWNSHYGLVALYNYPWGILILFDKETEKGFAKDVFYQYFRRKGN